MTDTLIFSAERVQRILNRLAYEVIERNRGAQTLEIFGIRRRGTNLAKELAAQISTLAGRELVVKELDVSDYRDDRDRKTAPGKTSADGSIDIYDRDVLLVDDVLFTGRTARAALDALVDFGRPKTIQLLVLIDRGHREYPIHPDYVGKLLQTKHKERVIVDFEGPITVHVEE